MPAQVKNYEEEVAKLSEEQALQRLAPCVLSYYRRLAVQDAVIW